MSLSELFSERQEGSGDAKDFLERLRPIIATFKIETATNLKSCSHLTAFIAGLHDSRIWGRLVMERDLTLDTALLLAES